MILFLFIPTGMHKHTSNGFDLFKSGQGNSGWSDGTAWVLGVTNCMYAFGGADGGMSLSLSERLCTNPRVSNSY